MTSFTCLRALPQLNVLDAVPDAPAPLKLGPPDMSLVMRARRLLMALGIPQEKLEQIHILVRSANDRRYARRVIPHVWPYPIPRSGLLQIDTEIYIVCPELCAQQIAVSLPEPELIECLMELTSAYALSPTGNGCLEINPLTTTARLLSHVGASSGQRGINKLRQALPFVRGRARSPMEIALCMLLILPPRLGGENLANLKLAHRINVTEKAADLTRRSYFECDAYLESSKTDFEYNGIIHETSRQAAIDTERTNALEAMGYNVMAITRHALFDPDAFIRLMRGIERRAGLRENRRDPEFPQRREDLRRFVLRRYLD